jgi:hypothetical protein
MTGRVESSEVRELLQRHHIGKRRAAELCAVNHRTFERWMKDRPSMPQTAWELLQIRLAELSAEPPDKPDIAAVMSILGKKGGASRSEAKQAASRENGKKGGRPKKET